jgi:hypothetical protein
MAGRGRRVAVTLIVLAVVLSVGRWSSVFLTERLWEASVSEAVAVAGARRAVYSLALELLGLLVAIAWLVAHFGVAAQSALPAYPPPEREYVQVWPARLPRWTLLAAAALAAVLLGGGGGGWLDHLLLARSGVRLGVTDPLLGADLGAFMGAVPLWLELQARAVLLAAAALAGVVLLHLTGGTIRLAERRIGIAPAARGHLAILLAALAAALAWGCFLEPYRLAAGLRGPLLTSEFLLRSLVAEIEAGVGAAAALLSLLWWGGLRGAAAFGVWALFALVSLAARVLPLHTEAAVADPGWQAAARSLDSIAFALGGAEAGPPAVRSAAAGLIPTLWDEPMLAAAVGDSGGLSGASRGWIIAGGVPHPVWFAVRDARGEAAALLALADDQVSPTGRILFWREGDSTPQPGLRGYRDLPAHALRPAAPEIEVAAAAHGVVLDGWIKRLMLAWALQHPPVLSARSGIRVAWRLDPAVRLRAIAPFARWTPPRPRPLKRGLVWVSDGLLSAGVFPSSARIPWAGGPVSMVRPGFFGVVDAESGSVRIFRTDPADSVAAAWARITEPLIEPPAAVPAELRTPRSLPEELLIAQARALEGPAWRAGLLEPGPGSGGSAAGPARFLPPPAPGGGEAVVPFMDETNRDLRALLVARGSAEGDSVRLVRIEDSTRAIESAAALRARWARFPFRAQLQDSVRATGGVPEQGRVRFALASDGVAAYQPEWAVTASGGGRAQLLLVSVALGRKLGIGRTMAEAWRNLRGETSPATAGAGAEAVLQEARRWMLHADSALRRGDLQELGRALANLKELLETPRLRR